MYEYFSFFPLAEWYLYNMLFIYVSVDGHCFFSTFTEFFSNSSIPFYMESLS